MIRKAIQYTYLILFIILSFGISGNIELNIQTPISIWIIFITSGLLTISKMIYCSINSNNKYFWN